ncbi:MAG TPA: AmmeMemoRadiSam system protein B, partial [Candidatus Brocadiia bacterium]|nr:AmmeMemoRadiSam system protein B [Candidatus Brocadiia bacterium]
MMRMRVAWLAVVACALAAPCGAAEPDLYLRPAAVAGSFYPAGKAELQAAVQKSLQAAQPPAVPGEIKIVIVPHAGYVYSADTAAYAFKALQSAKNIKTVLLMGSPHQAPVREISVWPQGAYRTPLGDAAIDSEVAGRIIRYTGAIFNRDAHLREHSLEVEVPFLQTIFPGASIVPMLVYPTTTTQLDRIANAVAAELHKDGVVLVVSTDLSHYPPTAEAAQKIDRATLDSIKTLDASRVLAVSDQQLGLRSEGLSCTLCALRAVAIALQAGRSIGVNKCVELHYSNSAAKAGPGRVVGYGALAFSRERDEDLAALLAAPEQPPAPAKLTPESRQTLLKIAEVSVRAALAGKDYTPEKPASPELLSKAGCFVTLKTNGQLRGCLGRFDADKPMYEAVAVMARASALDDP